jgi:hypothetical protein
MAYFDPDPNLNPDQFKHAVRNLRNMYNATPTHLQESGRNWYSDVHEATRKGIRGTSMDMAHGAGLVAAVSPGMDWNSRNIGAFKELHSLKEHDYLDIASGDRSSLAGMSVSQAGGDAIGKAHRIMLGEHPDDVLKSNKVRSFYQNIAHPHQSGPVTIDGRAHDIAANRQQGWQSNRGISGNYDDVKADGSGVPLANTRRYQAFAEAHRAASNAISEHEGRTLRPHDLQAVTWVGGKAQELAVPTKSGRPRVKGATRVGQPYL